jgi:hypothetical protein
MTYLLALVRAALVVTHLGGPTILCYPLFMAKSIRVNTKKRGRPKTTGKGELIGVRILPPLLKELDAWIAGHGNPMSRPHAIRRLVEHALAGKGIGRAPNKEAAHKALKMAARELEPLGDKSLPAEEQARRKRVLIKGPKEFRDVRADQPKAKK